MDKYFASFTEASMSPHQSSLLQDGTQGGGLWLGLRRKDKGKLENWPVI